MTDTREKADIVSRLRRSIECGDYPFYHDDASKMVFHTENMEDAATEITSLRKQLEEARAQYDKNLAQIAALIELCAEHKLRLEALAAIRKLAGDQP